jgi:hypothetical protein
MFGGGAGATPGTHHPEGTRFSRVARGRVPSGRRAPHEKTDVIKRTWYQTVKGEHHVFTQAPRENRRRPLSHRWHLWRPRRWICDSYFRHLRSDYLNALPVRIVLGQHAPLGARDQNVAHRVDDLAHIRLRGGPPILAARIKSLIQSQWRSARSVGYGCVFIPQVYPTQSADHHPFQTASKWRKLRTKCAVAALTTQTPGPKRTPPQPLQADVERLRKENARLQARLNQAEAIIDVQKKVPRCLGSARRPAQATNRDAPGDHSTGTACGCPSCLPGRGGATQRLLPCLVAPQCGQARAKCARWQIGRKHAITKCWQCGHATVRH